MSIFKSVVVGIDLLQTGPQGPSGFSPPVEEAIENGLWLAERARAKITFFASLDMHFDQFRAMQKDEPPGAYPHLRLGLNALDRLVDSAKEKGLNAEARVECGPTLVEIVREVERASHDVVIVGTRNVGTLRRLLFGSTAMNLLHHCPCPVWVTRPDHRPLPNNIVVTSDFSRASDIAVKLGLALGQLSGAKVNLLNAVDYVVDRKYGGTWNSSTTEYHARIKWEAREQLVEQVARVTAGQPSPPVELHVVEGEANADAAILAFLEEHQIDLLVMGTVARSGIEGVAIGNTSERLVTQIPCSMLAVKPADFETTIDTATAG